MSGEPINRDVLEAIQIALSTFISVVAVVRLATAVWYQKRFVLEDFWLVASWACAFCADVLYIYVLRAYFRALDVGNGVTEPYPTMEDDAIFIQKCIFAITIFYWSCLWAAKFGLLFLTKKIMDHVPQYMRLWWAVLVICIVVSTTPEFLLPPLLAVTHTDCSVFS